MVGLGFLDASVLLGLDEYIAFPVLNYMSGLIAKK